MAGEIFEEREELEERVVHIARTAKVMKGGRRFSFRAVVVVGDNKGSVGVGVGKARAVPDAIRKGVERAKKNMVKIPLIGTTIPHEVMGKFGAAKVLLKPASPGTGIVAGRVCLKPWTTAYVDSRGNVFPCCLAVDAGGRLRMGNVREDSFVRIWHGERYVRFRIAILENRRGVPICDVCPVEDAGLQRRFTRWFAWMPMRLKSA